MKYRSFAFAIALVAAADSSGGNLPVVDTSLQPGDAFYQYVNGAWLKATEIPADRSSMSDSAMLSEQADRRTREIIQETAQNKNATADAKKIADFYNAFMDEATIEKLGLAPIAPQLARDRGDSGSQDAVARTGQPLRADVDVLNNTDLYTDNLFGLWVAQDLDDPTRYAPFLLQGGLDMPDRDYYLDAAPAMDEIRAKYHAHIAPGAGPRRQGWRTPKRARACSSWRRRIADRARARVRTRTTSKKANNHWSRADFDTKAPGLDWQRVLRGRRPRRAERSSSSGTRARSPARRRWSRASRSRPGRTTCVPRDRARRDRTAQGLRRRALRVPRHGARRARRSRASAGSAAIDVDQRRAGRGGRQALRRARTSRRRPRRARRRWSQPHRRVRPPHRHARLDGARDQGEGEGQAGRAEGRRRLSRHAGATTRRLEIVRAMRSATRSAPSCSSTAAELAPSSGKPVDRAEWVMTPQTVNAVNLPVLNAMNFPAAILQPPYFDPDRPGGDGLRRDRRGHRPRDQPQLRRPGRAVRRHGPPAQLVDAGGPRALQGGRRRSW